MTQKEELAKALARVTELEGTVATTQETIANLEVVVEAQGAAKSELIAANAKLTETNEGLAGNNQQLIASNVALEKDNTQLKADAKSADERAREISARHGGPVPPKAPQANDELKPNNEGLKGRARLTAAIETELQTAT